MSKLINFFKSKNLERKFSRLGDGHKLGDASSSRQEDVKPTPVSVSTIPIFERGTECAIYEPSSATSKAGEAALERRNKQNRPHPDTSLRNAVKQEMEEARRTEKEAEELRERFRQKVVTVDKPSVLSRVLYWCPALFGHSLVGPRDEVDAAIHQYLLDEAATDFPEASTLILIRGLEYSKPPPLPDVPLTEQPTYSEWREKQKQNFTRILTNLLTNPDNATYRRLRMGNQLVRGLLSIAGSDMFFQACGFAQQDAPVSKPAVTTDDQPESPASLPETEAFLVISEDDAKNVEHLQRMLDLLSTAEPILPILYRDTKVFRISSNASLFVGRDQLPDEFFSVTKEEAKRILEQQQRIADESGMLLTKAMRERLRVQEIRLFRYVLIRVRFSSTCIIQGTFYAHDNLGTLRSWITECLSVPSLEYQLWAPPGTVSAHARTGGSAAGRVELTNNTATLTELGLAPSSLLNISFPHASSNDSSEFLRADLLNEAAAL